MGVTAKDALDFAGAGIVYSTTRNLVGKSQPAGVELIQMAGDDFVAAINLL
jgi:hypothetical protein